MLIFTECLDYGFINNETIEGFLPNKEYSLPSIDAEDIDKVFNASGSYRHQECTVPQPLTNNDSMFDSNTCSWCGINQTCSGIQASDSSEEVDHFTDALNSLHNSGN